MAQLDELKRQREALLKVRASGTRSIQHGEKRVEYRTDAEMAAALADLDRRIAEASGTSRSARILNLRCRKGY